MKLVVNELAELADAEERVMLKAIALREERDRYHAALSRIRDSNRHAPTCTHRQDRRRIAPCSVGCPVLVAAEALRPPLVK
jgi:hypothetical protein